MDQQGTIKEEMCALSDKLLCGPPVLDVQPK